MFKIKFISEFAIMPKRATEGSAGYDICSACVEPVIIAPGKMEVISTGFTVSIPKNRYAKIAPRSGLAFKYQIDVMAGVIDSDYRGEINVLLINHGKKDFVIKLGDRIAQMIFEAIETPDLVQVDIIDDSIRGQGGFGSTGIVPLDP